ncbi:hypothetical protein HMPREF0262_01130 [Clostridium sp. ATCC 29733]|nr:hypothetical protein HMPREF0262_01130 [Clostridium sp. ATCC 29733]
MICPFLKCGFGCKKTTFPVYHYSEEKVRFQLENAVLLGEFA